MVKEWVLISFTIIKVLLTVPVMLLWLMDGWHGLAVQCILMIVIGFFDGWISTLAVVTGPMKIKEEAIRGSLTSLNVLALLAGLAVGQIICKAITYGVEGTF